MQLASTTVNKTREQRLEEALRENLKRRKAQERGRAPETCEQPLEKDGQAD
jgi:hypothetical protein